MPKITRKGCFALHRPLGFRLAAAGLMAGILVGCYEAPPAAPPSPSPALKAIPAATPSGPPPAVDPATLPADMDTTHRKLVGTSWQIKKMTIRFIDAAQVYVTGPDIDIYAPGGLTTKYRYTAGSVEVTVLGKTVTAQWDGTIFSIGGMAMEEIK